MNDDDDDSNPINRALNLGPNEQLVPIEQKADSLAMIVANAMNDSASEDFKFSRANIREVIENGTDAMSKLALIADQSQNPRAFEVLAKLMDTVVGASRQLLELQEKIRSIDNANVPKDEAARAVTNNLFVGSTAELQKVIASMRNPNA
jgi:hypothetical protein